MGDVFSWWLAIEAVGIIALPLAAVVFANLPDHGWALSKPLALLALGWLIWFPLVIFSALPYSRGWILGAVVVFTVGNAALLRVNRIRSQLRRMLSRHRVYIATTELLFAATFALMAWLRALNPAVVDTEKFMDEAFIASIWRAPHLPPPDPWLSGYSINYYYYGHFLVATLAKFLGTPPSVAFNIGVALIFALVAVAVFSVAGAIAVVARRPRARLRGAIPAGLVSVALVLLLGNLNGAQVWWQGATKLMQSSPGLLSSPWAWWLHRDLWVSYDWWSPSRVIPNTINEFPAFSFTLADLHAHVLALPFTALAIALAFNLLLSRGAGLRAFGRGAMMPVALIVTAVSLGALYAINGWDLPTYLGLALLALAIQQWLAHERRFSVALLLDFAPSAVILAALSFLLYLPFYRGFVSPSEGIGVVASTGRSPISDVFAIFGLPLFITLSLVALRLAQWANAAVATYVAHTQADAERDGESLSLRLASSVPTIGALTVGVALALLLLWTRATVNNLGWTLFWALVVIFVCAALSLRTLRPLSATSGEPATARADHRPRVNGDGEEIAWSHRAEVWTFVLIGTAAALIATAEIIYLRDIFGTRMNTVFKLYYQAWMLLGVAGGPALIWLTRAAYHAGVALTDPQGAPRGAHARLEIGSLAFAGADDRAGPFSSAFHLPRVFAALTPRSTNSPLSPTPHQRHIGSRAFLASEISSAHADHREGSKGINFPSALRWPAVGGILLWWAALVALLSAALVYPVLATSARTNNFTPATVMTTTTASGNMPRTALTLDGSAYMANDPVNVAAACGVSAGSNRDDNDAIAWLNAHISGSPVILEAPGCEWSHYSRISSFTGLPTLIGWPGGHEGEWRINWLPKYTTGDIIGERRNAVNTIYTTTDQAAALALLHRYNVKLVYVGYAERALYPSANLDSFARYLKVIYARGGVTIYAVP